MESISPLQLHDRPVQEQQMEMESDDIDIQDEEQPSPPPSTPPPISPTREQQQICLTACAPSDAHLSELDDEEDEGGFPTRRHPHNYPYSSGSSPVSSFRMAVRQSRAPSTCGKFNQSLLGGLTTDAERLKSSLCVCTSIRPKHSWDVADDEDEGETATSEIFPIKKKAVTDEYKISHEIIGIGESGKVMASYHKRSVEKYALKVLRDSPRSRREIELHWLACRQPNVVSIVDIFENTFDALNCMLVVVEFMQGGDLLTLFESNGRNPYSEQCVARIVRQCGSAVQFLHERNVAHRDIKLENILCSTTNVNQCDFKLADFGFAKRSEPDRLMNSPCCTPAYVCPEILSYREYDKGCDIWALGVATYILLCGYPPFYSMQGLPFSPGMRKRITSGMFAFPSEDWDGVSASTKHMIRLMLRTDPTERITIQQLMTSDFLSLDPSALAIKHPAHLQSLPPVPSDSSLSSDAGFESTDSKDSGYEFQKQKEAERTEQKEQFEMEMENIGNSMKEAPPRAQFFLGNGTKSNSARQLPIGGANANFRPILRERVYSIQERMVDKALAFMRMGGGNREEEDEEGGCCVLKNPTKGPTGSRLLERRRMSCAKRGGAGAAKATTTEEEETETTTPTTPTNNIV